MNLKVLGISTSPRTKSSSDELLRNALTAAESAGANVEYLRLTDFTLGPCIECNACYKTGKCKIQDDYQAIMQKMLDADRLIFASPIFFMNVCAQAKILIDRCQCLWAHKYVLRKPLFADGPRDRRAMVIAVGGSKSEKMFECIKWTMKYFFDTLEMQYCYNLFVNQVEDLSEVRQHSSAAEKAKWLGGELVTSDIAPQKSTDIVLT
jgi:multimeric flavodoxin WrbA